MRQIGLNAFFRKSSVKNSDTVNSPETGMNLKQKRSLAEFDQSHQKGYQNGGDSNDQVEVVDSNSQSVQNKRKRLRRYDEKIKDEPVDVDVEVAENQVVMETDLNSEVLQSVLDTFAQDQSQSTMQTPVELPPVTRKTQQLPPSQNLSSNQNQDHKLRKSGLFAAQQQRKVPQSAPQFKQSTNNGEIVDQEDQKIGGGFQSIEQIKDSLPNFLKEQNIKDKNGRRPDDPNYDETTLHIPQSYWKDFTPAMTQYWTIKLTNNEKILFFKLGKFYEIFFQDAIVCQRLLDLNWMGGAKKLHVGFPEKALDKYLSIMVGHGFKVAVIEQTETPRNMENRHKEQKKMGQKLAKIDQCISRDIIEMVTRGTFQRKDDAGYEPQYILAYKSQGPKLGVTFLDIHTSKIFIGYYTEEDQNVFQNFRTLVCQIRPIEVIQEKDQMGSLGMKILKNSPIVPTFSQMAPQKCLSDMQAKEKLRKYFQGPVEIWPTVLQELVNEDESDLAFESLGMVISFLEDALICDKIITTGNFIRYVPESFDKLNDHMVLDSQCIEHLEIVQAASGEQEGSLFNFIDHCQTHFGKRELKRWLLSPLMNIDKINDRYDAIEDLTKFMHEADSVRAKLSKLPDIEKLLAKIFTYSIKHKKKAIYFEDVSLIKLQEFKKLLDVLKGSRNTLDTLIVKVSSFKSLKLRQLLTFDSEIFRIDGLDKELDDEEIKNSPHLFAPGVFPQSYREEIKKFDALIIWKKMPGTNQEIPEPQPGFDPEFDKANSTVDSIKAELNQLIKYIRDKQFNRDKRVQFSHAKFRYEIEVPVEYVKGTKKPKDFEFTSQKNGYERFHTPEIKTLVNKLEEAEEKLKDAMLPFLSAIFTQFFEKRDIWEAIVRILTEIDCLISLSVTSNSQDQPMTRPQLIPYSGEYAEKSLFDIQSMRHPCVQIQSGKTFIPNDTFMNSSEGGQSLLLVTGPNMGGKSTILRQNCIAAIMAQIGCFVPCNSFTFTPVDRIFTRLGASDRILEGKSTFFVEMEETSNILQHATFKSLAILDELGRGTSTFDGYSIAHAVLKYVTRTINCRCLFATHYHMLIDEFKGCPGVACYHMAYKANEDGDRVTFLYKFIKGECPQSFGINVARMAGIDPKILKSARVKSVAFKKDLDALKMKVIEQIKQ